MTTELEIDKWDISPVDRRALHKLPVGNSVYVLLFTNGNEMQIMYVGRSKNLSYRFLSHSVFSFLKKNIPSSYELQIRYKLIKTHAIEERRIVSVLRPKLNKYLAA